jgi:protein-tyrosine-phosphatase
VNDEYILFLCTANRCRSPLAAALLDHALRPRGLAVTVESAGLAPAGQPAMAEACRVAAERGLDLSGHRSTLVDRGSVTRATVVLGMERRHVREAVMLDTTAWSRTFTLKELVRRGSRAAPRQPDESLAEWLARLHAGRLGADMLGASTDDDVDDPVTSRATTYDALAAELDALLRMLVLMAWPAEPVQGQ